MSNPYILFLTGHIKSLLWFAILGAILALGLSLLQESQFEASGRLIIIPRNLNLDAYSASKAGERLGAVLIETIYSNAFLNDVLKSNTKINDDFGMAISERLKNWKKTVSAKIKSSSGVLELSIFHTSQDQALAIAETAFAKITENAPKYIGGQGVEIQVIDPPTVSSKPVKPSIFFNVLIGALIGFFGTLMMIYLFSDDLEKAQAEYNIKKRRAFPPPDLPVS